ncbi:MAG: hypothetical protein JXB17_01020 [Bacteroidales bacterium]|nr:hypothetical protein [Bacteroidales bacterium]
MRKNFIQFISILATCLFFLNYSSYGIQKQNTSNDSYGESESITLKKGEAKQVFSTISLTAGNLKIKGNAEQLMEGDFKYPNINFMPEVNYNENKEVGTLSIKYTKPNIKLNDEEQIDWDIMLNNDVNMDLTIKMGAGIGNYFLGGLDLSNLDVSVGAGDYYIDLRNSSVHQMNFTAGAGEANIDLSGKRKTSLFAEFTCGFGELTLTLPENIGVRVEITGLLGEIHAPGFDKFNNVYKNEVFGKTEYIVDIKITAAMGEINLRMVE